MLGKLDMNPGHLIHRFAYMKNDIPVAGCAHQAGTCRFGTDPATSVLDVDCQRARARQPLRRRHERLPEHRRGEPGPHGDGELAPRRRPPARTDVVGRRGRRARADAWRRRPRAPSPTRPVSSRAWRSRRSSGSGSGGGRHREHPADPTERGADELVHGDQRAVVVEVGGGLRSYAVAGRELLDGYRADEMCASGRGQVLLPWPNRIEDGQLRVRRAEPPAPAHGGRGQQRHPRPRALERVARRRARARPRRAGAHAPPPAGLSVLAGARPRVHALGRRAPGAHDRDQRRRRRMPVRVRLPPVPDARDADDRLVDPGAAGADGASSRTLAGCRSPRRRWRAPSTTSAARAADRLDDGSTTRSPTSIATRTGSSARISATRRAAARSRCGPTRATATWSCSPAIPLPDVNRRSVAVEPMTCPPNAFRSGEALIHLAPGDSTTECVGPGRLAAPLDA